MTGASMSLSYPSFVKRAGCQVLLFCSTKFSGLAILASRMPLKADMMDGNAVEPESQSVV